MDVNGKAIDAATVTVKLAGTSTVAVIYAAKTGGSAITGGIVTSDSGGYYKFYVDTVDYAATQLFDIVVSEDRFVTRTYPDVHIVE